MYVTVLLDDPLGHRVIHKRVTAPRMITTRVFRYRVHAYKYTRETVHDYEPGYDDVHEENEHTLHFTLVGRKHATERRRAVHGGVRVEESGYARDCRYETRGDERKDHVHATRYIHGVAVC